MSARPAKVDALERLWQAEEYEQVESSLIKAGGMAAKALLRLQEENLQLRREAEEREHDLKKTEILNSRQGKELMQMRRRVAELEAINERATAWESHELVAHAAEMEEAAQKEKEKRLLLESALNRLLKNWESSQHEMILTKRDTDEDNAASTRFN